MVNSLEQNVVVYDAPEQTAQVYATAYGEQQVREVVKRCTQRYGSKTNPRFMTAKESKRL